MRLVDIKLSRTLDDFAQNAALAPGVQSLREEAKKLVPVLRDRTVWMVNSTETGGGVAEMLPTMVSILRELGLSTQWGILETDKQEFFALTKQLHNLIHGQGQAVLGAAEKKVLEDVNKENAEELKKHTKSRDILVVHDPQPMAMGAMLKEELRIPSIWRCHIGLDQDVEATRAAWAFLKPYAEVYDHAVFTAPEYVPDYLKNKSSIIHPSLDPLSAKNKELRPEKLADILCRAGLMKAPGVVLGSPFAAQAKRLRPDGSWAPANDPEDIGLLFRPIIVQISRWDRLKGFSYLLEAFIKLKNQVDKAQGLRKERLQNTRLVLAGPDPGGVSDDPEALEVLKELSDVYLSLSPELQKDVALVLLPMDSRLENELMVNALQRSATIVCQNSLQEGFGLTATEAMWKAVPVLVSSACGLRQQIQSGREGIRIKDAKNPAEIAESLDKMLDEPEKSEALGLNARSKVIESFLVFTQLKRWLKTLVHVAEMS